VLDNLNDTYLGTWFELQNDGQFGTEGVDQKGKDRAGSKDSIVQFRVYKFDTLSLIQQWHKYIS
jgi:hypothetical protein